ncbi:MAG: hypothetical protein KDA61_18410, partial [Planctomycetales bacterium]|nr:hypothetical protein [Planctomycetales bacterium]
QDILLLAHTNAHVDELNRRCQEHRRRQGLLRGAGVPIYHDRDGDEYEERVYLGDVVVFKDNSRRYGVGSYSNPAVENTQINNGRRGLVIDVVPVSVYGPLIKVKLDNGRNTASIPVKEFRKIRLGYVSTNFGFQGGTARRVITIAGGPMQDLPASYVQMTRSIAETEIYTTQALAPDLINLAESPLADQMSQRPEDRFATEFFWDYQIAAEPDHEVRLQKVLYDWFALCGDAPGDTAVVASDEDAARVNQEIHAKRLQEAKLDEHQRWDKRDGRVTHVAGDITSVVSCGTRFLLNDRVCVRQNKSEDKTGQRQQASPLGTIIRFSIENRKQAVDTARIHVLLDSGEMTSVSIAGSGRQPSLSHAWALTPEQAAGCRFTNVLEVVPEPKQRKLLKFRGQRFAIGTQIRFTGDQRAPAIIKGEGEILATENMRGRIRDVDVENCMLLVQLDGGKTITVLASKYSPPSIERLSTDWQQIKSKFPHLSRDELRNRLTDDAFKSYVEAEKSQARLQEVARQQAKLEQQRRLRRREKQRQAELLEKRELQASATEVRTQPLEEQATAVPRMAAASTRHQDEQPLPSHSNAAEPTAEPLAKPLNQVARSPKTRDVPSTEPSPAVPLRPMETEKRLKRIDSVEEEVSRVRTRFAACVSAAKAEVTKLADDLRRHVETRIGLARSELDAQEEQLSERRRELRLVTNAGFDVKTDSGSEHAIDTKYRLDGYEVELQHQATRLENDVASVVGELTAVCTGSIWDREPSRDDISEAGYERLLRELREEKERLLKRLAELQESIEADSRQSNSPFHVEPIFEIEKPLATVYNPPAHLLVGLKRGRQSFFDEPQYEAKRTFRYTDSAPAAAAASNISAVSHTPVANYQPGYAPTASVASPAAYNSDLAGAAQQMHNQRMAASSQQSAFPHAYSPTFTSTTVQTTVRHTYLPGAQQH